MKKIEIEAITISKLTITYQIFPNFLGQGYRVFRKREWEPERTCLTEIYSTEQEAIDRITKHLDLMMKYGSLSSLGISSYQVYIWED